MTIVNDSNNSKKLNNIRLQIVKSIFSEFPEIQIQMKEAVPLSNQKTEKKQVLKRSYCCDECGISFSEEYELNIHKQRVKQINIARTPLVISRYL